MNGVVAHVSLLSLTKDRISSIMFSVKYKVPHHEIDSEYLHLHHTTSLLYLERARLALLETIGFPINGLIQKGLFIVVKQIDVRYLREVREETIEITCEQSTVNGKEFALVQRLINERGKDAIIADITLAILSSEVKRAVIPPSNFIDALTTKTRTL